jgi:L-threonylcarbamoyladenylate synthase
MKQPQIYKLRNSISEETVIQKASDLLRNGGVVICATDTGYLLGVDGLNPEAIRKIYAIKGRSFDKPIHLVVSDIGMAKMLGELDQNAERMFRQFMPGPLTLIVKKKPIIPGLLVSGLKSVGLRMPDNDFLLRLVKATGKPVTATSANRSGKSTPYTVKHVLAELGDAIEHVDLIIDQGETHHAMPSTIFDMSQTPPKILREGPITPEMLSEVLKP